MLLKEILWSEAETRWSAKAESVKAISEGVTELVELLESLSDFRRWIQEIKLEFYFKIF